MKQISKGKYLMLKALQRQAQHPDIVEITDEEYNDLLSYQDINISNDKIPTTLSLLALDVEETEQTDEPEEIHYTNCDFGVDGIGYIITSLDNSTVSVKKIFVGGNVVIPNTVTYNDRTFNVTSIENLYDSVQTQSIKFNDHINVTGKQLYGCGTSTYFVSTNNPYLGVYNGVLYNGSFNKIISYPEYKLGDSFEMPNSVLNIDEYAFAGNKYLQSIVFNDSCQALPIHFMYGCNEGKLKSLILPAHITTINSKFFADLTSLETLKLPADLTLIEKEKFGVWESIPLSVKKLTIDNANIINLKYNNDENENYIFYDLQNLTELHVTDKNPVALESNVLTEGKLFTVNLYIPIGTKNKYNQAGWNKFFNITEEGEL